MSYKTLQRSCAASIAFYVVGYSLVLTAFALPFWVVYDPEDNEENGPAVTYRYGLFYYCIDDGSGCHVLGTREGVEFSCKSLWGKRGDAGH